jgi:carboxylesterase type B
VASSRSWRVRSGVVVATVSLVWLLGAPAAGAVTHGGGGLTVPTDKGLVRGFSADGVEKFLGMPYAAPPVGELRWKPPAPVEAWTGVRSAAAVGNRCPQPLDESGAWAGDEDCLYLNVYRPRGVRAGADLPVLFWIHGGSFTSGSGDEYDGALLASTNHMLVVSINYRLGVFGFLALAGLGAEAADGSTGNYGMLDWLAALRWTHRNIDAFGGDRHNVTIAGQSSGGFAVCTTLTSPTARGLFSRAIIGSAACIANPPEQAEANGLSYAEAVGCTEPGTVASCLRALPETPLLEAAWNPDVDYNWGQTYGGSELPRDPYAALADGELARVPVLVGTTRDEGRAWSQWAADLTREDYEGIMAWFFGDQLPVSLETYPYDAYPSPYTAAYALGAVMTDGGLSGRIGGCPSEDLVALLSSQTRTYAYQFDDRHAPPRNAYLPGFRWGAAHTLELAYLFATFGGETPLAAQFTPAQQQLSDEMVRYWGAFARSGSPAVRGQAAWPSYRSDRMLSLRPGGRSVLISSATYERQHKCSFWRSLPPAAASRVVDRADAELSR